MRGSPFAYQFNTISLNESFPHYQLWGGGAQCSRGLIFTVQEVQNWGSYLLLMQKNRMS